MTNTYEKKIISYRNVYDSELVERRRIQEAVRLAAEQNADDSVFEQEEKEVKMDVEFLNPHALTIQPLWGYRCELTRGRQVMYISTNVLNEVKYLDVGYNCCSIW